jgi:hypothetical protein
MMLLELVPQGRPKAKALGYQPLVFDPVDVRAKARTYLKTDLRLT